MRDFTFIKNEHSRWYVVLPEWEGDKEDLEMVMGADTWLDIIAQGENLVNITLSEKEMPGYKYKLTLNREFQGGAYYDLESTYFNFEIWLCFVTTFVFGKLPQNLYCIC